MKTKLVLSLLCATVLTLTGCGHQHTWTEAGCVTPKTCSQCGATEGRPLGHQWRGATCTAAKTCSICGATEGEPLGHTWTEATYDAPKTCSVCGETEGEALPKPYFTEHNIPLSKLENMSLPFAAAITKNGQVIETPNGLSIEHGDASYAFGEVTARPSAQTGYIDVTVPCRVTLSLAFTEDISKYKGGFDWNISFPGFEAGDYYTGLLVPKEGPCPPEDKTGTAFSKEFTWDGKTRSIRYTENTASNSASSGWNGRGNIYKSTTELTFDNILTVTIPEGYDGAVLNLERTVTEVNLNGLNDQAAQDRDTRFLDDHTADEYFFFRLSDLVDLM